MKKLKEFLKPTLLKIFVAYLIVVLFLLSQNNFIILSLSHFIEFLWAPFGILLMLLFELLHILMQWLTFLMESLPLKGPTPFEFLLYLKSVLSPFIISYLIACGLGELLRQIRVKPKHSFLILFSILFVSAAISFSRGINFTKCEELYGCKACWITASVEAFPGACLMGFHPCISGRGIRHNSEVDLMFCLCKKAAIEKFKVKELNNEIERLSEKLAKEIEATSKIGMNATQICQSKPSHWIIVLH